ncbi:hypothetical protein [Paratissierella segnis]|nr:hypothetical protein [Paratissierella segnis]
MTQSYSQAARQNASNDVTIEMIINPVDPNSKIPFLIILELSAHLL